ncbi:flagellar hook protein FlgE [Nitrosomonas sp.]|uniref:flagellar hook protein FlgE n=1 Tax=Nitrosomonas sp. TaxID=42353 RepID=UPI00261AF8F2|nr:flagellar hook protein FlgE [Nitrosomonas sp.]
MSFQHGLSGLSAASTNLDVIGSNIANANTAGFKQSQAQFTDIFANSLGGSGSSQVGIGARVSTVAQSFSQGNISPTSNPLDIAINGQGFFRMDEGGVVSYSRNGQFRLDGNGFLTNANGANLTGYMADTNGNIDASKPTNLKLITSDLAPQATSTFEMGFNLNSGDAVPTITTFSATNPETYNWQTSGKIVDSLGNEHVLATYFQKSAANTWNIYATVDGKVDAAGVPEGVTLGGTTLTFDGTGALTAPTAPMTVDVNWTTINPTLGAVSPLNFSLDLTKATQYGAASGKSAISQDGFTSGRLAGFTTAADGVIQGTYTNGQTRTVGQIVLANFVNPQGLNPVGDGLWVETPNSGQPVVGPPKTGTLGTLQASAIEDANVDLTTELVKMITAQRMYQANAKTIETQDAVLQTLVNL